ncbi:hypothetical protein P3S67_009569 [Capsicum chacoense]
MDYCLQDRTIFSSSPPPPPTTVFRRQKRKLIDAQTLAIGNKNTKSSLARR